MRARYGEAGHAQAISYGEKVWIGDVSVRFVPAGHVLGSAQIVLEYRGERAVVSGDYKRRHDPTRSEEHTSELQSLMRISYAVFCLKKKKKHITKNITIKQDTTTNKQKHK